MVNLVIFSFFYAKRNYLQCCWLYIHLTIYYFYSIVARLKKEIAGCFPIQYFPVYLCCFPLVYYWSACPCIHFIDFSPLSRVNCWFVHRCNQFLSSLLINHESHCFCLFFFVNIFSRNLHGKLMHGCTRMFKYIFVFQWARLYAFYERHNVCKSIEMTRKNRYELVVLAVLMVYRNWHSSIYMRDL